MAAVNACPAGLPPSFRLEITDIALELVAASMRMMTGLPPSPHSAIAAFSNPWISLEFTPSGLCKP